MRENRCFCRDSYLYNTVLTWWHTVSSLAGQLFCVYLPCCLKLYQKDISFKFFMCPSPCPPDLQAHVLSLERSLEEERERCKMERKRRKELHNTLVVREQDLDHVLNMNHLRVSFMTLSLISWFAAGVKRKHQGSLQGASSSALWPHPADLLWIRVRQRMINRWQHEIIWNNWC